MTQPDNTIVSTHLGQKSTYRSTYDPTLLVREPRQNNRTHLGLKNDNLPFVGFDVWNAYEISCLLDNGTPIVAYAKIVYPCDSEYIVESKSLKLYLNSFNMNKRGDSVITALKNLTFAISDDLTRLLGITVQVYLYNASDIALHLTSSGVFNWDHRYQTLEKIVDVAKLNCNIYKASPNILRSHEVESPILQTYHSSLLKSNCRVTGQPDWGDIYIHCISNRLLDPASLLQYIISYRDENHFHEEVIETIYMNLYNLLMPSQLCVQGLYVRRGGIDINPIRASNHNLIENIAVNASSGCIRSPRQ